MPTAVSQLLADARILYDEKHLLRIETRRVHFPDEGRSSKTRRVSGDGAVQLKYLFDLLDSFGMKRSNIQKQLHLGMVGELLLIATVFIRLLYTNRERDAAHLL